jgi:hypothetical protein
LNVAQELTGGELWDIMDRDSFRDDRAAISQMEVGLAKEGEFEHCGTKLGGHGSLVSGKILPEARCAGITSDLGIRLQTQCAVDS